MIPYIEKLQAWANARVAADLEERSKKLTPQKSVLLGTFKSVTNSKIVYKVYSLGNDRLDCNCPGFTYRRKCKHLDMV